MAFSEDLNVFFDFAGFSVPALITVANNRTRTIQVVFDNEVQAVDLLDTTIAAATPFFMAKTSDMADVPRGTAISINAVNYKIEREIEDGTGISTVYLKKT